MSDRSLPTNILRNPNPVEIEVAGVRLLVRELSAEEYSNMMEEYLVISPTGNVTLRGGYQKHLIESCVIDPAIPDANILKPGFAAKLMRALQELMGDDPATVKNG